MELDEAFASKDEIAAAVLSLLKVTMTKYAYHIPSILVTDLSPDSSKVKNKASDE
jgi:hypothetical protein